MIKAERNLEAPHLSTEVFAIPLGEDRFLVYAPLRRSAFVTTGRVVNSLVANRADDSTFPAIDEALCELMRRLEILDAAPLPTPAEPAVPFPPAPTSVTLFLTTACNLRCSYCYASAGQDAPRFMSLATARRGIDFVAGNALRTHSPAFEVGYHGGGEPSMNWPVLTASCEYARRRARDLNLEAHVAAATNGVLTDSQIDWVLQNLDGLSVSFDGLPEAHDGHRCTVSGGPSSEYVMRALRRFDAVGFEYGIRMTVTREQLERLPDSVEFICARFRPKRILIEPAYPLGRGREAPSAEIEGFIEAYRRAQARAAEWGQTLSYSAARLEVLSPHFCAATHEAFALSPDGGVSACYEVFSESQPLSNCFFYGREAGDSDGYIFDRQVLRELQRCARRHQAFCRGCFARWHCGGDCLHKALSVNPTGEFAGTARCHINRELIKDQILACIAASGGLFWHEPGPGVSPAPACTPGAPA